MDIKNLDLSKYDIEIIDKIDPDLEDVISYLGSIVQDRSIPEENKIFVTRELERIIEMSYMSGKRYLILKPKEPIST